MIAAILRAQWLSMYSFRMGARRGSAAFSAVTAAIWYGFWGAMAYAAQAFLSMPESAAQIDMALPLGLLLIFLYWQLAPILSASLGASLDLRKLLAYPVPHRKLFLVEVLLRLTTCVEMLILLAGVFLGLMRNPDFNGGIAALRTAAALGIFVVFNLLLAAGLRAWIERLMSRRGMREAVVFLIVMTTAAPRLLVERGARLGWLTRWMERTPNQVWPWTAASRVALHPASWAPAIVPGIALIAWAAAAYAFGRWQFQRSLRYDPQAAGGARSQPLVKRWSERFYRLPSLMASDPIGAIAEKELRSLARSPRFRLVFLMGFSFGLLVWLPIVWRSQRGAHAIVPDNFLTIVSVYALVLLGQVSYLNAFGFDRAAAQVYFSAPVSVGKALAGKNLAACLLIAAEMLAVTAASVILRINSSATKIAEAFIVTAIVALYLLAIGNLLSVYYPRAMNPERVAHGGAGNRFQSLIFLFYPVVLLPVFLAFVARHVMESEAAFWAVLAFAAGLGVVLYWIAMDSAVLAARRRQEALLTELARADGPVITD